MLTALLGVSFFLANCNCNSDDVPTSYSQGVIINEVYPNPADGEEEFIELKNVSGETIDLTGWQVSDASGKTFTLATSISDFLVIYQSESKIYLNNDGETVNLIQPDGAILQTITSPELEAGISYSYFDSGWCEGAPTPGAENVVRTTDGDDENTDDNTDDNTDNSDENTDDTDGENVNYTDKIKLIELYPDPAEGEEEYVKLENDSGDRVDLTGWKLQDASGKTFTFGSEINDEMIIYQSESKIYLNNDTDTVSLIQPDGNILEMVTYEGGDKGWIYEYKNGQWSWDAGDADGNTDGTDANTDSTDENTDGTDKEIDSETEKSADIYLNEILPDPEGVDTEDEFIELYNAGDKDINLLDWQITDGSSYHKFSEDTIISSKGYLTLYYPETKVSLNNSGDSIYLIYPDGEIKEGITYGDTVRGESWSKFDIEWAWGSPTPNGENVRNADDTDENADNTDGENANADIISISTARELENGTEVIVEGIVLVEPGILGTQFFYIQDDEAGIQVYSSKKDFPEIHIGDYIRVTGKLSESYSERKINISFVSLVA